MSEEILINSTPVQTRVALVESGVLQEIYVERSSHKGLVGNIYVGRVMRVLPGMQAAFVDIGLERASFLHASDLVTLDSDGIEVRSDETRDIRDLVCEGQSLVVQVVKDPLGSKGARLTTHLSVSSRYLVFMPYTRHVGISQRIEDEAERERLRALVERSIADAGAVPGGFIVRTAAEGVGREGVESDMRFLVRLWGSLRERIALASAPARVHEDLPLPMRTLRDLVRPDLEKIRIDSTENFERLREFARQFVPEAVERLELYQGDRPIFDLYSVEDEIEKALGRRVQLKSGGYLIVDQTEAMTTIDVNTGGFVGSRNLEETIFKTNLEAATALARQLRVRNLGGIIIIDFIDMQDPDHKRQVLRNLERALERDHARTAISTVSELGLVQMTRKRTRESLEHTLCETCSTCQGRGTVKSAETVCYEIFREILREARSYENDTLLVLAAQSVVDRLLDEESGNVADLEEFIGKTIRFQVETLYTQEQYDVVLL
ncbi:MAG: ribonuclease G [Pseudomonadales bacterium]|jgi:ribonuclease G|nr:ribonuclease G [Pseudomonadales bacterium]MBP9032691.1 ribonuclease G [Pseudomonadales bacterium]